LAEERSSTEIDYGGRPVVITGGEEPLRAWRGFFSGDDFEDHGDHEAGAVAPTGEAHARGVTIQYEGQTFELHRTTDGDLHSHDLPTLSFTSAEDAARTVAELVDQGVLHGRTEEPEQP
jgi:hypothetical protein